MTSSVFILIAYGPLTSHRSKTAPSGPQDPFEISMQPVGVNPTPCAVQHVPVSTRPSASFALNKHMLSNTCFTLLAVFAHVWGRQPQDIRILSSAIACDRIIMADHGIMDYGIMVDFSHNQLIAKLYLEV